MGWDGMGWDGNGYVDVDGNVGERSGRFGNGRVGIGSDASNCVTWIK